MHGPRVLVQGRPRKTIWVSLLDDASRLIAHSAFCLAETALEIEGVLKQGCLKRASATNSSSTMDLPIAPVPCKASAHDYP